MGWGIDIPMVYHGYIDPPTHGISTPLLAYIVEYTVEKFEKFLII
jgi:hypothetical protein